MKYINLEKRPFVTTSYLFLALILFSLLFFLFSTGNAYELVKTEQRMFDLNSGAKLQLDVDISNIKFITWDKNKASVQMRKWVDAGSEREAEEKMKKLEVDFVRDNDLLKIIQLNRQNRSFFSNILQKTGLKKSPSYRIDFVLKIPLQLIVFIDQHKGTIKIDSLKGNLNIKLEEGEIDLNKMYLDKIDFQLGNVQTKIHRLAGNISQGTNMVISCKKGNFILRDSYIRKMIARMDETNSYLIGDEILDCDLETDDGDIFIRPLNFEESKYKTYSEKGDIFLLVPEHFNPYIKLETGLGVIKSNFPWEIEKRGSGAIFEHKKTNSNKGRMEIITELGDIFVENRWDNGAQ